LLDFIPLAICEDEMSNLGIMLIDAPRDARATGPRRLPYVLRVLLLVLHQSRRRMAKRIIRQSRHLRDESGRATIAWLEPK
jgi:hypothetical protein